MGLFQVLNLTCCLVVMLICCIDCTQSAKGESPPKSLPTVNVQSPPKTPVIRLTSPPASQVPVTIRLPTYQPPIQIPLQRNDAGSFQPTQRFKYTIPETDKSSQSSQATVSSIQAPGYIKGKDNPSKVQSPDENKPPVISVPDPTYTKLQIPVMPTTDVTNLGQPSQPIGHHSRVRNSVDITRTTDNSKPVLTSSVPQMNNRPSISVTDPSHTKLQLPVMLNADVTNPGQLSQPIGHHSRVRNSVDITKTIDDNKPVLTSSVPQMNNRPSISVADPSHTKLQLPVMLNTDVTNPGQPSQPIGHHSRVRNSVDITRSTDDSKPVSTSSVPQMNNRPSISLADASYTNLKHASSNSDLTSKSKVIVLQRPPQPPPSVPSPPTDLKPDEKSKNKKTSDSEPETMGLGQTFATSLVVGSATGITSNVIDFTADSIRYKYNISRSGLQYPYPPAPVPLSYVTNANTIATSPPSASTNPITTLTPEALTSSSTSSLPSASPNPITTASPEALTSSSTSSPPSASTNTSTTPTGKASTASSNSLTPSASTNPLTTLTPEVSNSSSTSSPPSASTNLSTSSTHEALPDTPTSTLVETITFPNAPTSTEPKTTPAPRSLSSSTSPAEIEKLTEKLFMMDENNAFHYVNVDLQNKSIDLIESIQDRLMNVRKIAYEIPTIKALLKLYGYHQIDTQNIEIDTVERFNAENNLVRLFVNTTVMQRTFEFLAEKGFIENNINNFIDELAALWFNRFERIPGISGSSAFEAIFMMERHIGNQIFGGGNWIYYATQEEKNKIFYIGYTQTAFLGQKGQAVELFYANEKYAAEPNRTIIVGTSPELEMALYTVCFYTTSKDSSACPIKLGGQELTILPYIFYGEQQKVLTGADISM